MRRVEGPCLASLNDVLLPVDLPAVCVRARPKGLTL